MKKELTRRDLLGRAGLALGGAVSLGVLNACDTSSSDTSTPPVSTPQPQVNQTPYRQFLPTGYQLDAAAVKQAAYDGYYAGGCCHGAYSALLGHLAQTVGAPFDLLPLGFGKFGAGGIASYGSICGAVLGSALVANMVVEDPAAPAAPIRNPMIVELLRWYEQSAFPQYAPTAIDASEQGKTTLDFSQPNLVNLQVVPGSHLCHASVSKWCAKAVVSATSPDKLARCSRLTADVAGKTADLLNRYLAGESFTATPLDATSSGCGACHPKDSASIGPSVASGMACTSCHPEKTTPHY